MKHLLNLSVIVLLSVSLVFTSCKKDEAEPTKKANENTITIDASDYGKWVYFSFAKGKIVEVTDFKRSHEWDIGFHRQDIRVNCGKSGSGKGGTYNFGKVDFDSVTEAPEEGYTNNGDIEIMEKFVMPPVYVTVPGDAVLGEWIKIIRGEKGPEYSISNNIYAVRTAYGKYAKVWLKDYFNDKAQSGHITMKYVYQADGSRKF